VIAQPGQIGFAGQADRPDVFGAFTAQQTVLIIV